MKIHAILALALAAAILSIVIITQGCAEAPELPKPVAKSSSAPAPSANCAANPDQTAESGRVTMSLSAADPNDRWAYWRAGTSCLYTAADSNLVHSLNWDLRLTKQFPVVGTNGGATAAEQGNPSGQAAVAVLGDDWRDRTLPESCADIQNCALDFTADYHGPMILEKGGQRIPFGKEYHNLLINTVGPGMLSDYDMQTHNVTFSRRVFILRAADGQTYYAVRFDTFDPQAKIFGFEWRRLKRPAVAAGPATVLAPQPITQGIPETVKPEARVVDRVLDIASPAVSPFSQNCPWIGVNLETGELIEGAAPGDGRSWHIRAKQGFMGTNHGRVALAGDGAFAAVKEAPKDFGAAYAEDKLSAPYFMPRDSYNAVLQGWWDFTDYNFQHHYISPHPKILVLRTQTGNYAKLEIVGSAFKGFGARLKDDGSLEEGIVPGGDDGKAHLFVRSRFNVEPNNPKFE